MNFDAKEFGEEVAGILGLDGDGHRLMPLVAAECSSEEARRRLGRRTAAELFPRAAAPEAALAGLWLYFSCFEEAHTAAQDIPTPDGSFWHGILHRQEPDAGNAAYWFRRVGSHPIFPALNEEAARSAYATSAEWDPFGFVDYCESARRAGGKTALIAMEVQRAEWQLLFRYCARPHP